MPAVLPDTDGPHPFRAGVQAAPAPDDPVAGFLPISLNTYRELGFKLGYRQHGGSGLGETAASVDEMDLDDILWSCQRVDEARTAEADALRAR